jgi:polysaccharide export outer membrane protein
MSKSPFTKASQGSKLMDKGYALLLGALLFALCGCSTGGNTTASSKGSTIDMYPVERAETYLLEAPDEIEISVLPQAELNRTVTIRPDGKISLPLIGDLFVEGMSTEMLSQELTERFSKYVKNASVSVIVTGFNSKKVYVVGEVFVQGAIPYSGTTTVFEAVEEAGSFTRRASLGRVILVRGDLDNPQVIDVNLKDVVVKGIKRNDLHLQPNDIVFVPPNGFAKAGYAVEQVLFPFMPVLAVGSSLSSIQAYEEAF